MIPLLAVLTPDSDGLPAFQHVLSLWIAAVTHHLLLLLFVDQIDRVRRRYLCIRPGGRTAFMRSFTLLLLLGSCSSRDRQAWIAREGCPELGGAAFLLGLAIDLCFGRDLLLVCCARLCLALGCRGCILLGSRRPGSRDGPRQAALSSEGVLSGIELLTRGVRM